MSEARGGSIVAGSLWMIGISLLLIWLPGVGGFLSGAGKALLDGAKDVGGAAADAAKSVTKGIGDLFKKK